MPLGFSVLINNNLLKSLFITMSLEDRPGYDPADNQYQVSCLESSNFVFYSSISRSIISIHILSIKVKNNRCDKPNEITNQKYFHQQSSTSAYLRWDGRPNNTVGNHAGVVRCVVTAGAAWPWRPEQPPAIIIIHNSQLVLLKRNCSSIQFHDEYNNQQFGLSMAFRMPSQSSK